MPINDDVMMDDDVVEDRMESHIVQKLITKLYYESQQDIFIRILYNIYSITIYLPDHQKY